MDPDTRSVLLALVGFFVFVFGAMTFAVIGDTGLDVLSVTALVVLVLVLAGLIGAIRNPPD
jgi:hypothetical protein